ncbi:hypothetical protein INT43_005969 [Umbelopsis isabellina]|uniref:Uncharacterized protein n=1 Tax=Mortierella isabellina TaxID=91625 RepID=A0A8H7UAZ5_MORIS|nr:hypothetical protein INT43_005969 [Umbelopsis isabellina]
MSENQVQNGDQSELKNKILKQVEFYFGDANLPFDKFLYTLTTTNTDRWVPIATIANFKKMKMLSEDAALITEALKESPELLEVSEDGLKVRRKTELVRPDSPNPRTIYAKGFPTDVNDDQKAFFELQEEVEKIFNEFGKVSAVRMRKTDEKPPKFKGSVYVEYASVDDAKNAAEQKLKYKDTDLLIMTKEAYVAMKAEQYKDKPNDSSSRRPKKFNAFAANDSNAQKIANYADKKDTLLKITTDKDDLSVDDIKDAIGREKVGWVNLDNKTGYIELNGANASELLETINSSEDIPVTATAVDGDEANIYFRGKHERQQKFKGGRGRGGGRGGKRKGDNPNRTAVKARKTEA